MHCQFHTPTQIKSWKNTASQTNKPPTTRPTRGTTQFIQHQWVLFPIQLLNITTPNHAFPLCHLDFTKFRSAFACKHFDPTPAYPPTTICIIPATELLTHLKLISKLHPPHKYLLNFMYLRHPQTAPKGWNIHKTITPRGITKAHI